MLQRSWSHRWVHRTSPGRQAFQEVPEDLIAAVTIISMVGSAKEGAELGLRQRQPVLLQERDDVVVLELERHPDLLQHGVVGDGNLDGVGRSALVLAPLVDDEAVQE